MASRKNRVLRGMRQKIQESELSVRTLAKRYQLSPTTVQKWRNRPNLDYKRPGPKRSTALSEADEVSICEFRKENPISLDASLRALSPTIPRLTRSNLYRCWQRHGLSGRPKRLDDHGDFDHSGDWADEDDDFDELTDEGEEDRAGADGW